jgi:hypothetical protein
MLSRSKIRWIWWISFHIDGCGTLWTVALRRLIFKRVRNPLTDFFSVQLCFCKGYLYLIFTRPVATWALCGLTWDRTYHALWIQPLSKFRWQIFKPAFIVNLKALDLLGNTTKVRPTSWTREHWNTGERIFCKILGFSPSKMVQECGLYSHCFR